MKTRFALVVLSAALMLISAASFSHATELAKEEVRGWKFGVSYTSAELFNEKKKDGALRLGSDVFGMTFTRNQTEWVEVGIGGDFHPESDGQDNQAYTFYGTALVTLPVMETIRLHAGGGIGGYLVDTAGTLRDTDDHTGLAVNARVGGSIDVTDSFGIGAEMRHLRYGSSHKILPMTTAGVNVFWYF